MTFYVFCQSKRMSLNNICVVEDKAGSPLIPVICTHDKARPT